MTCRKFQFGPLPGRQLCTIKTSRPFEGYYGTKRPLWACLGKDHGAAGASQLGEKDEEGALRYDATHETQPAICEMINSEM